MMKNVLMVLAGALLLAVPAAADWNSPTGVYAPRGGIAVQGTPHVGAAQVADVGMLRLDGGFDYGSGIKFNSENSDDFSSFQFLLSGGYGYMDNLELGGRLAYESNSGKYSTTGPLFPGVGASNNVDIDDNGLEYVQAYAKYLFNPQIAAEVNASFAGDNKIYRGMDGFDVGITGFFTSNMGVGTLHGKLGWVMKSGDHNLGGVPSQFAQQLTGYENIFTYGVGFEYPYQNNLNILAEIHGWQSPYDKWSQTSTVAGGDNYLAADLGVKYQMQQDLLLNATVGFGLSDGAPDFAIYGGITKMFDMGGSRRGTYSAPAGPSSSSPYSSAPAYTPPPAAPTAPAYTPAPAPQVSPAERARQALARGDEAFRNRDYATSALAYQEATTYEPQNALAYFNLGVSYYQLERFGDAVNAYNASAQLNPSDAEAQLWLGLSYYKAGDSTRAIAAWRRVLQLDPNNATAQSYLNSLGAY